MTQQKEAIIETFENGIFVLTLNRPDSLNAMNGEMVDQLSSRFAELAARTDVRVVIITGTGRAFCVGADLRERATMSDEDVKARILSYRSAFSAMSNLNKPVICAINGFALGGGLEIALACDLRICAADAKVGLTETRLGIIPGAGGTQRLARVVGPAKAKELIFTANRLTGEEAKAHGVVHRVSPSETLMADAIAWAKEIALSAPIALAQAKRAIDDGIEMNLEDALDFERQCYAVTIPTEDRLEGLAAFAEKRPPVWKAK